jgi:hypothetical protein
MCAVMALPETPPSGSECDPLEALRRLADVGKVVRSGETAEQKRVLQSVFERMEFSMDPGKVARVEQRPWFLALFRDMSEWLARCARRDSNPRSHRFEVCGSIH